MAQHHGYSIADVDSLIPYERDLYFDMIIEFIRNQNKKER